MENKGRISMPELKLSKLKFLRIRTNNERDTMYTWGGLRAAHIDCIIGKVYEPGHTLGRPAEYIESVITLNEEFEEEAIDILRHLSTVNRLWKQKVSYETITQLETEYTRALGEEFEPELRMK
jgi:hypothetical protein